jgi:hypothetical protein
MKDAASWGEFKAFGGRALPREKPAQLPEIPGARRRHSYARKKARYNLFMVVVTFLMRVLELMFFLGLAGSSVVVLISFYEDGKELFGKD